MSGRQSAAMDAAIQAVRSGSTAYAAAKQHGVSRSAIYRACKRHGIALGAAAQRAEDESNYQQMIGRSLRRT